MKRLGGRDRSADYSEELRIKLEAGRHISARGYLSAQQYRQALNRTLVGSGGGDVLLLPTVPVTPPARDADNAEVAGMHLRVPEASGQPLSRGPSLELRQP